MEIISKPGNKEFSDYKVCCFLHKNQEQMIKHFIETTQPIALCIATSGMGIVHDFGKRPNDMELDEFVEKQKELYKSLGTSMPNVKKIVTLSFEALGKSKVICYEVNDEQKISLMEESEFSLVQDTKYGGIMKPFIKESGYTSTRYGSFKIQQN